MLSIDFIRTNTEKVEAAAKNKNRVIELDKILQLDDSRIELIQTIQKLREERNSLAHKNPDQETINRGREIKDELKKEEEKLTEIETELNKLISYLPNVPLEEVPVGKNEEQNVEVKKVGEPKKFDFEPQSHIDLALALDLVDLERGAKVSGFRGYFLKNELAVLHFAVLFYGFMQLVKKGYTPLIAPSIVKGFTMFGSGQFPWSEEETYKLNDEDAYLSGTAEVAVTALHSGETLLEKDLPKKYVAFSPCFRKEAGSYGKDTRGLYRLHEFWKVEQVIVAPNSVEEAKKYHEELQKNTEEIMSRLGLPYRVLLMCTGDMGEPQIKKYDTEIWMPYRKNYGEIASNSIMGDFQARRLKIRYKTKEQKTEYCYTLNDTAVPSPRVLIAILENYQQKDGSIKIPEVLIPFTGFDTIKAKK